MEMVSTYCPNTAKQRSFDRSPMFSISTHLPPAMNDSPSWLILTLTCCKGRKLQVGFSRVLWRFWGRLQPKWQFLLLGSTRNAPFRSWPQPVHLRGPRCALLSAFLSPLGSAFGLDLDRNPRPKATRPAKAIVIQGAIAGSSAAGSSHSARLLAVSAIFLFQALLVVWSFRFENQTDRMGTHDQLMASRCSRRHSERFSDVSALESVDECLFLSGRLRGIYSFESPTQI